jgi:hypothetical protein
MGSKAKNLLPKGHDRFNQRPVRLEVDVTGTGVWIPYQSLEVPSGKQMQHEFPADFSANWVRAVSNHDTNATVQFEYR